MNQKEEQGGIISFIVFILIAGLILYKLYKYFNVPPTPIITETSANVSSVFSTPNTTPDVSPVFSTPKEGSEEQGALDDENIVGGMQIKLCQVSVILAYLACIYIISTIYYLIVTRSYGTPFKDALEKYPELKKIKMKSAHERGNAFYVGLAIGVISMVILKPFGDCF